ncbi:MAG: dockerin type I domain-containing protein, partial [Clostridia bacterium]|nr:dockerin type I domain-containing protein [Clostridia bacterium]
ADFTTVSKIIGDVDGDWTTGASDVVAFRRFFSAQADAKNLAENINADINGDGVVNAKDLLALRIALAA